jgi:broad specificity phosphatase PhoE
MDTKGKALRNAKKAEIVVIRHGATAHEKTKMGGWEDEGLGSEGKKEAERAAGKVKDLDGIVTSDLERALETARIISKETGVPILKKDKALRSWNMGEYTGKDPKDVEPILDDLEKKHRDTPTPEGESFNEYKRRFLKGIMRLEREYAGKKIGIVTHSHGTRMLRAWDANGRPDDLSLNEKEYQAKPMPNGGVDEL